MSSVNALRNLFLSALRKVERGNLLPCLWSWTWWIRYPWGPKQQTIDAHIVSNQEARQFNHQTDVCFVAESLGCSSLVYFDVWLNSLVYNGPKTTKIGMSSMVHCVTMDRNESKTFVIIHNDVIELLHERNLALNITIYLM